MNICQKIKYSLFILIFLSVLSLILLNSRTSILTALIGLFYVIYLFNKRLIKWILISLFACSLLLFFDPVYELFEIYFRLERISTGRDAILLSTLNVIKENWFLGAGPAGTKYELYKNLPFMLGSPVEQFIRFHYNEIEFGHAHNFYLFFFSDLGIIGFILSLLLPVLFFRYGSIVIKKLSKNSFEYYTAVGITASGLCLFLRGIFEWGGLISYGTINNDLPFWLLFSILIGLYKHKVQA
jgi:O-antigen ligase